MNINAVSRCAIPANNSYKTNFGNVIKSIGAENYTIDLGAEQKPEKKKGLFSRIKGGANSLIINITLILSAAVWHIMKAAGNIFDAVRNAKDKVCGLFHSK